MKKGIMLLLVCMLVAVGFVACGGGGGGAAGGVTVDNSRANGTFTIVAIDAAGGFSVDRGTVTFDGAGHGVYTSLTSTDAGAFTYTVTVPGNTLTIEGTTIGTLNAAGTFFSAADVSGGSIFMMSGVKRAVGTVTDTSITYVGGDFQYSSGTGTTAGELFSIVTATPSSGSLLYTNLVTTASGATNYELASNGTFTIDPAGSPETFGAVSPDQNIMIFADAVSPTMSVAVALKLPGLGMSNASLSGTYMGYEFIDSNVATGPAFEVTRYRLTFDGNGNGTGTVLGSSNVTTTGTFSFAYVMNTNGTFEIAGAPGGTIYGVALQDGSVFAMIDPDPIGDNSIMSFIAIKQ